MSRLEVYAVRPDGDIESYGECFNSWGGGVFIWEVLAEKLGEGAIRGIRSLEEYQKIWDRTSELSTSDQILMRSTFDKVIIRKKELPIYQMCLREFLDKHPSSTLDQLLGIISVACEDDNLTGICFNWSSVSSSPWGIEGFDSDGIEHWRPYNIFQDDDHWFLNRNGKEDKK